MKCRQHNVINNVSMGLLSTSAHVLVVVSLLIFKSNLPLWRIIFTTQKCMGCTNCVWKRTEQNKTDETFLSLFCIRSPANILFLIENRQTIFFQIFAFFISSILKLFDYATVWIRFQCDYQKKIEIKSQAMMKMRFAH